MKIFLKNNFSHTIIKKILTFFFEPIKTMKLFSTAFFASAVVAQIDYLNYEDYTYDGSIAYDYGLDASPADYGLSDADFFTPEILELLESADLPNIGARALGTSAKKQLPPGIKIGDFFENGVFNAVKFRAALREAQQAAVAAADAQQAEFEAAAEAQEAAEAAAQAAAQAAAEEAAAAVEAAVQAASVEAAAVEAAAVKAAAVEAAEAAIQAAAAATTQAPARTTVSKTKDDRARPSLSDTSGAVIGAENNAVVAGTRGFVDDSDTDFKYCRKCVDLTPAACASGAVESCDDSNPLDGENICAVRFITTYSRQAGTFVEKVTTGCKNRRACLDNMSQNFIGTRHLGQQCRPRAAMNKRFAHDSVCHYCSQMSDSNASNSQKLLFNGGSTDIPSGSDGSTPITLDTAIRGNPTTYIQVGNDGVFGLDNEQIWY